MSKKQSLRFRLIAYPLLGAFFAVCAYFIALSAMGYQFKYQNGKLEKIKTGSIILSSRPGDASVFLNDKKYESNTPMFSFLTVQISRLKPGDYQVKLEKTGYENWQGVFKVYSGLVSWGTQILLLPQNRTATAYNMPREIESQIVSADKTRIFEVTHDKENQSLAFWQINVTSKNRQNLYEKRLEADETYRPMMYSDDNQRILFEHTVGQSKTYVVFEAVQNPTSWEVTDTFKTVFDGYVFNPKNHDELICTRGGDLFRVSYVAKTMSGAVASNVKGVFSLNGTAMFVQKTEQYSSLYRLENNNSKTLVLRDLPVSDAYAINFLTNDFGYAVLPFGTKNLLLYPTGDVDAKPKQIADQVDYLLPSPKYQFLGYGRAGGFYCYELDKDRYFTTFEGRKISTITWFNDQFNLAYIENGKLKMITFAGFYDKDIFDASGDYPVVASPDGPRLYYVATNQAKKLLDLFVFDYNS